MGSHHAGAVLFTVNLRKLAHFYEQVVGMHPVKTASDHVVLDIEGFRLTVHQIPESYAKSIVITTPPFVRKMLQSSCRFGSETFHKLERPHPSWAGS